jgi:hypothetical protein
MKRLIGLAVVTSLIAVAGVATTYQTGEVQASDHDDGENDSKERALNLTDHFAFKSPATPTELSLIMYFNPRSLPGKQYFLSTNARYELHVNKVANKANAPTTSDVAGGLTGNATVDNFVFRFEAAAPDAAGVQAVTTTVIKDGAVLGTHNGNTTGFAASKAGGGNITINNGDVGGITLKYFIGMRADSFHFDVVRFFQVRAFLAQRFFGKGANKGDATADLARNCRGDKFFAGGLACTTAATEVQPSDGDCINLWNPPTCAPDFTKNYNVSAIVLNVPIAQLGATVFDTWSTISVAN